MPYESVDGYFGWVGACFQPLARTYVGVWLGIMPRCIVCSMLSGIRNNPVAVGLFCVGLATIEQDVQIVCVTLQISAIAALVIGRPAAIPPFCATAAKC